MIGRQTTPAAARCKTIRDRTTDEITYRFTCGHRTTDGVWCGGLLGEAERIPLERGPQQWLLSHPLGMTLHQPNHRGVWRPTPRRGTLDARGHRRGVAKDGASIGRRPVPREQLADDMDTATRNRGMIGGDPNLPILDYPSYAVRVVCSDCDRDNLVALPDDGPRVPVV